MLASLFAAPAFLAGAHRSRTDWHARTSSYLLEGQQERELMHGLIQKPLPKPEEMDRLIQSAVESGADEGKLRGLASQGMMKLLAAPEILFVWQRTWPEFRDVPELILASRTGYSDKVLQLIRRGDNPDVAQDDGTTPLIAASEAGSEEIVKYLITAGARPNIQASDGRTALMAAAYVRSTAVAKLLLEAGADANLFDRDGVTALFLSARSGNSDLTNLLLEEKSIVDRRAKNGWTALMYAAQGGSAEIVERLIQAGASVETADVYGQTPLIVAAHSPSVLRILLKQNAEVNHRDADGETALIRAAADDQSLGPGNLQAISLLLAHGADADVDAQDNEGRTALMRACAYDDPGIVRLLLDHGASPQTKDRQGRTSLSIAISAKNQAIVDELRRNPGGGALESETPKSK